MFPTHVGIFIMTDKPYFKYWGKADRNEKAENPSFHLLPYHCLDVAAVGKVLLNRNKPLLDFFVENAGLDETTFVGTTLYFLALHDIGKFSDAFQGLREDLLHRLQGTTKSKPYDLRHDSLGFLLWQEHLEEHFCSAHLPDQDDQESVWDWQDFFEIWALAFTGHHGQPPKGSDRPVSRWFQSENIQAAEEFSQFCGAFFLSKVSFSAPEDFSAWNRQMRYLSWWLAGFVVLCDWLGSNSDFFQPHSEVIDLETYWQEIALPQAEKIVRETDILPLPTRDPAPLSKLFPFISTPTPLQKKAGDIQLGRGPHLFILEDVTGAGKTEAAFMLLHRLMASGRAEGAYFALPTMATANAMYQRTGEVYGKLYADQQDQRNQRRPSLVLAHGARHLMGGFVDSVLPVCTTEYDASHEASHGASHDASATVSCAAWLADNRKKALLAHIGVGTIDQALLAILCSRHQSMRLLGLRNKVLIVDEVHACDAYMHKLLQTLLTFHAAAGGSAILLSATLPRIMREELLAAYAVGLGQQGPIPKNNGYPLLSMFNAAGLDEQEMSTRSEVRRNLSFTLFAEEQKALDLIFEKTAQGQCVAWVCNTVADAMERYAQVQGLLAPERIMLFHARFALGDRLAMEEQVLLFFGKKSTAHDRQGRVLIATQVIEQSLDLDFDWLISDLAPIDLLIQRAGRLRRHTRDEKGNPVDRPDYLDKRGAPTLHVLGPDPLDDAGKNWFSAVLPKAVKVYDDHGRLWLTARYLRDKKLLRIPEDMREAVEHVYGQESDERIPEGLVQQSQQAETAAMTERSFARRNGICFEEGYSMDDHEWWDESVTPTRLGEASISLRLARWQGGKLHPWFAAEKEINSWSLSEVNVRKRLAAEEAVPEDKECARAMAALKKQWAGRQNFFLLVPLLETGEGSWQGCVQNDQGEEVVIRYSMDAGLAFCA